MNRATFVWILALTGFNIGLWPVAAGAEMTSAGAWFLPPMIAAIMAFGGFTITLVVTR